MADTATMHEATIAQLTQALQDREVSSRELTEHFLSRIARLDDDLNAFVTVTRDEALAQAELTPS